MLWGSKQSLSRGIREPKMDISRVRECRLCGLGAVLGREIRVDSKTPDPGEFCQTRLQDIDTLSQTKQSCSYVLVHVLAHFWEEDKDVHRTKCRYLDTEIQTQQKARICIVSDSCTGGCLMCVYARMVNTEPASAGFSSSMSVLNTATCSITCHFVFFPKMIKILGHCCCILMKTWNILGGPARLQMKL